MFPDVEKKKERKKKERKVEETEQPELLIIAQHSLNN